MPQRNMFSRTVTQSGLFLDGFEFFCDMVDGGILPDKFAYSGIVLSWRKCASQFVVGGVTSDTFNAERRSCAKFVYNHQCLESSREVR
ncbi:hypothetical protein ACFX2B_001565 [Malus domestica]